MKMKTSGDREGGAIRYRKACCNYIFSGLIVCLLLLIGCVNNNVCSRSDLREICSELKQGRTAEVLVSLKAQPGNETEVKHVQQQQLSILEEHNVKVVTTYRVLPQLLLKVDYPAFKLLIESPYVVSIAENNVNKPLTE